MITIHVTRTCMMGATKNTYRSITLAVYLDDRYLKPADADFVTLVTADVAKFEKTADIDRVLVFPPVGSYHRLLIHKTVEDFENLCSFSIGQEDNRRSVVCLKDTVLRAVLAHETHGTVAEGIQQVHKKIAMSDHWEHAGYKQSARAAKDCTPKTTRTGSNADVHQSEKRETVTRMSGVRTSENEAKLKPRSRGRARRPDVQVYVPRGRRSNPKSQEEQEQVVVKCCPDVPPGDEDVQCAADDMQPPPASDTPMNSQSVGECSKSPKSPKSKPSQNLYVPKFRQKKEPSKEAAEDKMESVAGGDMKHVAEGKTDPGSDEGRVHKRHRREGHQHKHRKSASDDQGPGEGMEQERRHSKHSPKVKPGHSREVPSSSSLISQFHEAHSHRSPDSQGDQTNLGDDAGCRSQESSVCDTDGSSSSIKKDRVVRTGKRMTRRKRSRERTEAQNDSMIPAEMVGDDKITLPPEEMDALPDSEVQNDGPANWEQLCHEAPCEPRDSCDVNSTKETAGVNLAQVVTVGAPEDAMITGDVIVKSQSDGITSDLGETQEEILPNCELSMRTETEDIVCSTEGVPQNINMPVISCPSDEVMGETQEETLPNCEVFEHTETEDVVPSIEGLAQNINTPVILCPSDEAAEHPPREVSPEGVVSKDGCSDLRCLSDNTMMEIADHVCSDASHEPTVCDQSEESVDIICPETLQSRDVDETAGENIVEVNDDEPSCERNGPDENLTAPNELSGSVTEPVLLRAQQNSEVAFKPTQDDDDVEMGAALSNMEAEDADSWDMLFNEEGEALDPSIMEELMVAVGKVTVQKTAIDYLEYTPKEIDLDYDEYSHLIEIYDFPNTLITRDLIGIFKDFIKNMLVTLTLEPCYRERGFDIKWVDDNHAIAVFNSTIAARDALSTRHPMIKLRPISQASRQTKLKAKRCTEFLQPYKPRPETVASVARNMVAGALGLRSKIPREVRAEEGRRLREARDKKKQASKQKKDAWDGVIGKCAMDK